MDKEKKTKPDKSILFKFVLVFLVLLVFVLIVGTIREYLRQKELDKEMAALQEEINNLNLDKSHFLTSIEAYKSEFFVEQEARLKFNLQKPGEKVLVIPANQVVSNLGVDSGVKEGADVGGVTQFYVNNVRAWWYYFFQVQNSNN